VFIDNFVLEVDDIRITGQLYLPGKDNRYPVVCLCHGVPSGLPPAPGDGGYPELAERLCRDGHAVIIFNFRGTGDSGGNMDLLGWTRDLQAVVDHLYVHENIDNSRISLVGFSGGAAAAVYVASKDSRVSGIAACACPAHFGVLMEREQPREIVERYRSIGIIRDDDYPPSIDKWLEDFLQVTPLDHVAGISPTPLLIIHGDRDETVPVSHAYDMYEKANEPKELVILEGAGHRLRQEKGAIDAVLRWLNKL
jgi:dipeptidyl aminopeptidase/acylaminoacyl peptidase